ncbi:VOC family protein [Clostridium sp. 'deep sea']|uniref:VOC family protein n=1 Tax=Clostridium sp. 'deep sea' TaxID=2779445 RepID=UPI0018967DCF|nr:VOC family protein [Clostridium sp. 'deep sea']QOR35303.1 VOC family protein [Clostridium sp. 'deep sea']
MSLNLGVASQITWLYFKNISEADVFLQNTLKLKLVEDHGWAKIYSVANKAFLGAVESGKGTLEAKDEHAMLYTLVVDSVEDWHKHIKASNMTEVSEIGGMRDVPIKTFFATGPGGYKFEFQAFLNKDSIKIFHNN